MRRRASLSGAVVVITGAGSGIGAATARLIAGRGARLHLADVNGEAVRAVAAEIEAAGGEATCHTLDVSDAAAVEQLAATVFAAKGRVDVLHNNAGIGHGANIEATSAADWERVISVNLLGVAYGVQAFVPRMLAQGGPATVVNTASLAGLVPMAKMAPYCASKFGVVGLSEALNAELSGRGIRVVAICPGIIDTPIVETGIVGGDLAAIHERITSFYERRGASPEAVAASVLRAIERPRLIVGVPRSHVVPIYLLHRLSPRLVQPLARNFERLFGPR
ncbi:MAG: SDR family NAD(P)-dependent oxidoreductase [Acidobacteriota bacterium]|nr:SDR family NAD(P)-dependent oxidoreductase [Acidobacteriota bacterium]